MGNLTTEIHCYLPKPPFTEIMENYSKSPLLELEEDKLTTKAWDWPHLRKQLGAKGCWGASGNSLGDACGASRDGEDGG